jgi:2-dehydropantoate 2-reductase
MLQDLESGRAMEIDALVTAVQELGRIVGVPTPAIDIVQGLVSQLGRMAGTYESLPQEEVCNRSAESMAAA